jgi:hypothetical protein
MLAQLGIFCKFDEQDVESSGRMSGALVLIDLKSSCRLRLG